MKALVIGGTGPTGPGVVQGLLERGYEVTIYHRGLHEVEGMPEVHQHLHGDADDPEALKRDLGGYWDVVCAMYGRDARPDHLFAGRCDRIICIAGQSSYVRPQYLPFPQSRALPVREDWPRYVEPRPGHEHAATVAEFERSVLEHHARGDYAATVFTYTSLYGPRAPRPLLWPIVRRILDGRRQVIVPGGGGQLRPMCYADNAVHQLLLALDRPEARGQSFNSVDCDTYRLGDIVRLVAEGLGVEVEVVGLNHPYVKTLTMGYAPDEDWMWDAGKLMSLMGYRDAVPAAEGIRRTAQWQAAHRDEVDTPMVALITRDPYAYAVEDQLIASYRDWVAASTQSVPAPLAPPRPRGDRNFRYMTTDTMTAGKASH